jgi:hypothetical protein
MRSALLTHLPGYSPTFRMFPLPHLSLSQPSAAAAKDSVIRSLLL